jgi:hypothetical protein
MVAGDRKRGYVRHMLIVGWQERVDLPLLGLTNLKAKIDTGARTSALHATDIVTFERDGPPWVRFHTRFDDDARDTDVECPIHDRRAMSVNTSGVPENGSSSAQSSGSPPPVADRPVADRTHRDEVSDDRRAHGAAPPLDPRQPRKSYLTTPGRHKLLEKGGKPHEDRDARPEPRPLFAKRLKEAAEARGHSSTSSTRCAAT